MGCLTFNINKNFCFAAYFWLLEIFFRLFTYIDPTLLKLLKKDTLNEYYFLILLNISDLISGFFVLYVNCTLKKRHSSEYRNFNSPNNIKIIVRKKESLPKSNTYYCKLILICLLDYLCRSAFFIFFVLNPNATYENISHKFQKDMINHLDILFRYVFSYIILKFRPHKHQIIAIFSILIIFIFLSVFDFISMNDYSLKYVIIFSLRGIFFPLEDTIIKLLFNEDYITPESIMFKRGFGEFFIILISTSILCKYGFKINDFKSIFISDLMKIILVSIIYICSSFIKALVLLKVIYYYSSQSVSFLIISESIACSLYEIKYLKDNKDNIPFIVVEIICIILTLFSTLVYDEIIVIKKCGLDKYVESEIAKRAKLEKLNIGKLNSVNDEEEEEESEEKNNNSSSAYSIYI